MARPPELSLEQRAAALRQASISRKHRAETKAKIKSGELSVARLLTMAEADLVLGKMRVSELLESLPGVGKVRASALMTRLAISPTRRIQGLGVHQLAALKKEFEILPRSFGRGKLVVLSGPGGVGKSTVAAIVKERGHFWVSISATTRLPRANERNGIDYYFLTDEEFAQKIANDEFLEWAEFAGAKYGTPREGVESALAAGQNVLLEIEIAGARQVRAHSQEAILVFLLPPSWEDLVSRLENRGSDSPERRAERLELAQAEMAAAKEFSYSIVNGSVEKVVEALVSLVS